MSIDIPPIVDAIQEKDGTFTKLLEQGADPNTRFIGIPVLHLTISLHDFDSMRALLRYGADINAVDSDGKSAIDYVFDERLGFAWIEYLIHNGIKIPDEEYWSKHVRQLTPDDVCFLSDHEIKLVNPKRL